jgi:hypothetical protein
MIGRTEESFIPSIRQCVRIVQGEEIVSIDLTESDQHHIRVISIYATRWRWTEAHNPQQLHLPLGQLEEFYSLFESQLPQVINRSSHAVENIAFVSNADNTARPCKNAAMLKPANEGVQITRADSWLFVLPSDQVVAALDFDVRNVLLGTDPSPIVKLLEQCTYARLTVDDLSLETHIATLAKQVGAEELDTNNKFLPPERHQIVFAEHVGGKPPDDEIIKVILYRLEPPNRPEFMEYRKPSGLNEVDRTLCAVTPNVSLLYGQRDYVENSVFLTAVQAVGTAARFRQIWHKAHGQVRKFRKNGQTEEVGTQRRG